VQQTTASRGLTEFYGAIPSPSPPALVFDLKKYLVEGDLVTIANENNWNYEFGEEVP
jgi:hypothetical protein